MTAAQKQQLTGHVTFASGTYDLYTEWYVSLVSAMDCVCVSLLLLAFVVSCLH